MTDLHDGVCEVCDQWVPARMCTGMIGDGPSVMHCGEPYCRRVAFNRVNGYPDNEGEPKRA